MEGSFNPTATLVEPLSTDECAAAVSELYHGKPFTRINRKFVDPQKPGEPQFALFSFVHNPTDKDVFGVGKIRGAFYTQAEADARAQELVRDVDSANSIYTCRIGVPFPLVSRGKADELTEVDLQKKVEQTISDNVRHKREQEKKEMDEIMAKREALLKEEPVIGPEDEYVQQRVKLAHLRYAINEHDVQRNKCIELERQVRQNLLESKERNPEYEETYLERYRRGRRAAGIPEDTDMSGFMKYIADDI